MAARSLSGPAVERDAARANSSSGTLARRWSSASTACSPRGGDRRAMLGHRQFERRQPRRVGALVGEQLVAGAHGRVVAGRVVGMARLQRQHQAVEEAAALARAAAEQPVHGRGQPQDREPFGQRVDRGSGAIDAHLPPLGRRRLRAGADVGFAELRGHCPAAAAAPPRHVGQCRAAQAAPGREQRHRLEQVGLARAIVAGQQDEARAQGRGQRMGRSGSR